MRVRVRRVGVLQMAKIVGLLYALIALVLMPFLLLGAVLAPEEFAGGAAGALLLPAIYGAVGFAMTALSVWLFNVVAGWVGGMELELDMHAADDVTPPPTLDL